MVHSLGSIDGVREEKSDGPLWYEMLRGIEVVRDDAGRKAGRLRKEKGDICYQPPRTGHHVTSRDVIKCEVGGVVGLGCRNVIARKREG